MSSYQNKTGNDLDNYDAEIVEDIPEQFDLSRYRKQKSSLMGYNRSSATSATSAGGVLAGGYSTSPMVKASPMMPRYAKNPNDPAGYAPAHVDPNRYSYNPLDPYGSYGYAQGARAQDAAAVYNATDYAGGMPVQSIMKPHYHHPHHHHAHHIAQSASGYQLPHITGTPLAPSSHVQAPIAQYPTAGTQSQSQIHHHHSSGMDAYGGGAGAKSAAVHPSSKAYEAQKKPSQQSSRVIEPTLTSYRTYDSSNTPVTGTDNDDSTRYSRRKLRNEEGKSKSPSSSHLHERSRGGDYHQSSEFYTKEPQYATKKTTQFAADTSEGESDTASQYSDDNTPAGGHHHSSTRLNTELGYRHSFTNNDPTEHALKSNLKAPKKHGVKFDEKLEVYEVNNPHYGVEAKSEKREIKRKKKDKKKEDEILMKTKVEIRTKIQNQKALLYHYYENTLLFNALNYYEENFYRGFILKFQDKLRNSKLDDKLRDQFLQSIEKDNQATIDIMNAVKNVYSTKLQQYCMQFQCQPEALHTFPGMMQTMHSVANSINYIEIINSHANKESDTGSTLSKILGHDSKSEKSQLSNLTTVKAPIKRKHDIMPPKLILNVIDSHVRDVANDRFKTLTELIFKLREICETDLHLIRALFKYVLLTQLETLRGSETGSCLMRNFDTGLESANTIFSRLCSFAGIENRCVRGLWKNITCEPGEKTELKCLWNVVYLTTGWRFIQPAFTPVRYFSKPETKYEETEFYFLSDPDSLYYEFLPLDKIWIFGDSSLNVKDFEKRPILTPHFRTLNLSVVSQESNLISHIEKEPFKLTIQYPHNLGDSINFKYKLKLITASKNAINSISDQNGDLNFNQYVISEIISNEDAVVFKIPGLPEIGHYTFTIFTDTEENNSQAFVPNVDNSKGIAAFKLSCSKIYHFEPPPNHIHEINLFGMNNIMKKLGLVCCDFNKGVLGTDREGKVNLVFEMLQPLDIEVYLYSSDVSISSKFLELCILKRVVHNFLILIIYPPHPGLYGLDLHGAPRGTFNSLLHSQLPPLGKYLIKSHHQVRSFIQFPKGDNRDWGPKQRFYDLGLHTVGNIDPYIINEDGKQIEIEIAMLKPLTIWYKFDYDLNGTTKAIDNYCFMNYKTVNKRDKTVSFLLRFPSRGFYHLAIMATEIYPSKPDEIVYNYLIRVQDPSNDVQKFPIIVNPILWRECSLITPKNYVLSNYDTHFSVIVPNSNSVQVTTDEGVSESLEAKEIENSWVGLVSLYNAKFVHLEIEFEGRIHRLIRFKGPDSS